MPRDSGKIYSGTAESGSGSEGAIAITIEDKAYKGTWVSTSPRTTTGYSSSFGWGWGGWHGGAAGAMVTVDNPQGSESKALLTAPDGSGLRCDLRGGGFNTGGGVCRDDRGREYDVQVRPVPKT
jgi:hypothetical protein